MSAAAAGTATVVVMMVMWIELLMLLLMLLLLLRWVRERRCDSARMFAAESTATAHCRRWRLLSVR